MAHYSSTQTPPRKQGINWFLMILTILIVGLGRRQRDRILDAITTSSDTFAPINDEHMLFIGKEVSLQGTLDRSPNNKYTYTHSITDNQIGTVGLRSSTINLYNQTGVVYLSGKVADFAHNMYIIEVTALADQWSNEPSTLYFQTPGILLQNMRKSGFTITQNSTINSISLMNPATQAKINIRYFVCSQTEDTYNCQQFEDSLKNTSGAISSDNYNTLFYKLINESTRFTNLENRYGIHIETSVPELFPFIAEKLQFITTQRAVNHLGTSAKSLCKSDTSILNHILSGHLVQEENRFAWHIIGLDSNNDRVTCDLNFDPNPENVDLSLTKGLEKITTTPTHTGNNNTSTGTTTTATNTTPPSTTVSINSGATIQPSSEITDSTLLPARDVKQFPLRPGKEMSFSTRGINLLFPSPNISFNSQTVTQGPNGIACSSKTNIIAYANKDQVNDNPSVIIYMCPNASYEGTDLIRKMKYGNTTLYIEVKDESWIDFANAITITNPESANTSI